ncbi:autotransporter assembly complex protein TamA [Motiliproteus sediminis]|uniref:autotransporter assembly complex protein TamA n=1 Tax=Motiliproteus sediminis TaxID=1468178 RepID=UPI001AEFF783
MLVATLLLARTAFATPLEVVITGVDGELSRNVSAYLTISQMSGTDLSDARVQYLHRRSEREVRQALEPYGYYQVEIDSSLQQSAEGWRARYHITPGPQVKIAHIDLRVTGDGAEDAAFRALELAPGISVAEPLIHEQYQALKSRLQNLAAERGYYDAQWVQQKILVDRENLAATVVLHYNTGIRYRYGDVRFSETPLEPEFIQRFVRIKARQPVLTRELLQLQARLNNTDYFQRVEVRPLWQQRRDGVVPIQVELEMRKRTRYRTGIGYDTDTRTRLTAGVTRRWVNASGHSFDTQAQLSPVRSDIVAQYRIPGKRPESEQYSLRTAYQNEHSDPVDSETWATGISWQRLQGDWIQILGLDLERESFTIDEQPQKSRFIFPRASWSRTHADNRLNVRRGYRLTIETLGSSDLWYSDTSFVQGRIEAKGIYALGDNWRLLGRTELGGTVIDDRDALPASKRFFAGGDNSVRGYRYKTLAPLSEEGNIEGGQGLIVVSAEIDYRLLEEWRLAIFADHGSAINSLEDSLSTGVGGGIRWLSPIGPVRIDIGWALDLPNTPWRLHFSIGPDL